MSVSQHSTARRSPVTGRAYAPPAVIASGRSAIVPVIVLEAPAEAVVPAEAVTAQGPVTAGTPLLHLADSA